MGRITIPVSISYLQFFSLSFKNQSYLDVNDSTGWSLKKDKRLWECSGQQPLNFANVKILQFVVIVKTANSY